jgi:hypothetical protein
VARLAARPIKSYCELRVPRLLIILPLLAVVVGLVWVVAIGTLFGAILIIGGVFALLLNALPGSIDRVVGFLSTGVWRRR